MPRLPYMTCPGNVMPGLEIYYEYGIGAGDFLEAVLCNDLREACGRADHVNQQCLWDIVAWLYNNAPARSWGSPESFISWAQSGGFQGQDRAQQAEEG